jgi:hypothetical protein
VATCPNCEERFRMREYRKSSRKSARAQCYKTFPVGIYKNA